MRSASGAGNARPPATQADSSNKLLMWGLAAAGLVLAIVGVFLMMRGGARPKPPGAGSAAANATGTQEKTSRTTTEAQGVSARGGGASANVTPDAGKTQAVSKPEEKMERAQASGRSGIFADMGDIREESARRELDRIAELEKGGPDNALEVRRRYEQFLSGSHASSKAGKEAAERFKALPPVPSRPPDKPGATEPGLAAKSFEKSGEISAIGLSTAALKPIAAKTVPNIDFPNEGAIAGQLTNGRKDDIAVEFTGFIEVPRDGAYTFTTNSDDGSALYIGNTLVVNNDGGHAMVKQSCTIPLLAGKHRFKVTFFQGNGPAGLIVSWSGPDFGEQTIPASAFSHTP